MTEQQTKVGLMDANDPFVKRGVPDVLRGSVIVFWVVSMGDVKYETYESVAAAGKVHDLTKAMIFDLTPVPIRRRKMSAESIRYMEEEEARRKEEDTLKMLDQLSDEAAALAAKKGAS